MHTYIKVYNATYTISSSIVLYIYYIQYPLYWYDIYYLQIVSGLGKYNESQSFLIKLIQNIILCIII